MHSILFSGAAPAQAVKSRFTPYHIQSWRLHIQRTDISRDENRWDEEKDWKSNIRKKIWHSKEQRSKEVKEKKKQYEIPTEVENKVFPFWITILICVTLSHSTGWRGKVENGWAPSLWKHPAAPQSAQSTLRKDRTRQVTGGQAGLHWARPTSNTCIQNQVSLLKPPSKETEYPYLEGTEYPYLGQAVPQHASLVLITMQMPQYKASCLFSQPWL